MHIFGIAKFSQPLLCSKDSLGQSVEICIADNDGTLTLPSLPEWTEDESDPLHIPLVPPTKARTWKRGEKPLFWGRPISYPDGKTEVKKALLEFNVASEHTDKICQEIYYEFRNWLKLFEQYIVLLKTQNKGCAIIEIGGVDYRDRLELFEAKEDGLSHISNEEIRVIEIIVSDTDESLHLGSLKDACRLASLRLSPRLEYAMLLEAYSARQNADYRKAIIEAATALEICLTDRIIKEFKTQGISFGEKLLRKFRALGGRLELIQLLNIPLPDKNYAELIANPRNDVIHKASFPDRVVANQVISEVEDLLRLFSPIINQEV